MGIGEAVGIRVPAVVTLLDVVGRVALLVAKFLGSGLVPQVVGEH